jgi:hypothetical protein
MEAYRGIPGDLHFIDGGAVIATNALADNVEWIHQVVESFGILYIRDLFFVNNN